MKAKKDEHELFNHISDYEQRDIILVLIRFAKDLENYPIELVLAKHLMKCGVDTEEKLTQLLRRTTIYQPIQVNLQNYFRDIVKGVTDINTIPSLPMIQNNTYMEVIIEDWASGEYTIHDESGSCLEDGFTCYEEAEAYAIDMGWTIVESFHL